MLRLNKVTFPLSDAFSLDDFSVELARGECIGLYGANGCGKSTLLNLLAGILPPRKGCIFLNERNLGGSLFRNFVHGVILFPQANPTSLELSWRQLAALADYQMQSWRGVKISCVQEVRDSLLVQIDEMLPLSRLSYGECRLATLQLWLALKPKLLLLDEPFAGLNESLLEGLSDAIRRPAVDCVTFLVDHDLNRLRLLCSSIWKFEGGVIERQ